MTQPEPRQAPDDTHASTLPASGPGLCFLDTDLRIVSLSAVVTEFSGLPRAAHLGRTPTEVWGPAVAQLEDLCRAALQGGEPVLERHLEAALGGALARIWLISCLPVDAEDRRLGVNLLMRPTGVASAQLAQDDVETALEQMVAELAEREERTCRLAAASAEEALHRSEREWRSVIAVLAEGVLVLGADGHIRLCNASAQHTLGATAEELVGSSWQHPRWRFVREDRNPLPLHEHPVAIAQREGKSCRNVIMGVQNAEQELRWISVSAQPLVHPDLPRPHAVVVSFMDITARRQAEDEQARLAAIVESSTDAIIGTTPDGTISSWNAGATQIYGYRPEEVVGRSVFDLIPPECRQDEAAILAGLRYGERVPRMEAVRVRKDGHRIYVARVVSAVSDAKGAIVGASSIERDVTERKAAQEELARLNRDLTRRLEELQTLLDVAPVGIAVAHDPHARCITMNPAAAQMRGVEPGQNASMSGAGADRLPFRLYRNGRELQAHELPMQYAAVHGVPVRDFEVDVVHKDGHRHTLYEYASPLFDEQGAVRGCLGVFVDITQRKRAEEALRQSEEFNRGIMQSIRDCIKVLDLEGRLLAISAGGQRLFGMDDPGPYLHQSWVKLWKPKDRAMINAALASARAGGDGAFVACCPTIAGELKWWDVQITPILDARGKPERLLAVARDITERRKAEDALRESRERLVAALEAGHTGTFRWEIGSHYIEFDEGLNRLYGLPPGNTVHRAEDLYRRVHAEDLPAMLEAFERSALDGVDYDTTYRVIWPDGSVHWLAEKGRTFADAWGIPVYMTGACVDITERKRAEEALRISEERFRTALKGSPIIVSNQDRDLRYTWIQNVTPKFPVELVLGKRDSELLARRAEGRALEAIKRRVLRSGVGERAAVGISLRRATRYYDLTVEPLRDAAGEVVGITCAAVDITRHMRLEAKLRKQARQLAEADRRKDEFLAMLAHELRNPLTPIRNAVHLLRLAPAELSERSRKAVEVIDRQLRQLTRLVDDLLDVARITRGRIRLQQECVNLAEVVAAAVETAMPRIEARRHRLEVTLPHAPVHLRADAIRLSQVLGNLLNNAAKYTEEQGRIWLGAKVVDHTVRISVRDSGIGIAPENLAQVFDLFTQGDRSLDRAQGGLGIGLTLVRSLVEMHGGRVDAHSAGPGQGSEFVITLPTVLPQNPCQQSAPSLDTSAPGRRILVVDDNHDVAKSLAMLLAALGHEVSAVHDGPAALEAVRQARPQVVFLDIGLPEMDGYEVARRLRKDYGPGELMLVALTGYGQEEVAARAREAGFDHYLLKPGDLPSIEALLSRPAR